MEINPTTPPPGSDKMDPFATACLLRVHYNASCSRMDHSITAKGDGSAQRIFFVPGDS